MRTAQVLLLIAALAGPVMADEAAPFVGLDGLDALAEGDRAAKRLERLAGLGPSFVRTAPIEWGRIQAGPSRRGPATLDWKAIDEAILVWQLSGFQPIPVLSPRTSWAGIDPSRTDWARAVSAVLSEVEAHAALRTARGVAPLRRDAWHQWDRFVRAFVERYDGDGKDDMPGLRRPIRYFQIMDRADSPDAWLGTPDEYLRLVHHAGLGAKWADPATRLIAAAIDLRATGHGPYPDEREWDFRIGRLTPKGSALAALETKRSFALARRVLSSSRLYDVAAHVGSDTHADDVANLAFTRRFLDENGGREIALWLVDNPTRKLGEARAPGAVKPRAEERRLRRRWLPPALNPRHSEHAKALSWLRRGQAIDLVRSVCRARAAGADVVLLYASWDALSDGHPRRKTATMQGLIARAPNAPPTEPLERTPGWYALQQAARLLHGHHSAGESPLGAPGRSIVFTFQRARERPWISVLMLDERLSWAGTPGAPLTARDVTVPLPNGKYVLESCRLGESEPRREEVSVETGMLNVKLTPAPLYVIPKR